MNVNVQGKCDHGVQRSCGTFCPVEIQGYLGLSLPAQLLSLAGPEISGGARPAEQPDRSPLNFLFSFFPHCRS